MSQKDIEAQPLMGANKPSYTNYGNDTSFDVVPKKNQYEAFKDRDAEASAQFHHHKLSGMYS